MKDLSQLSEDELKKMDKNVLITIIITHQKQLNSISSQLEYLSSQIALKNQRSFGHKTEKLDQINDQMDMPDVFNEAEFLTDPSPEQKITEITVQTHTRKKKSTSDQKLEGLPTRIFDHELSKEELMICFRTDTKNCLRKSTSGFPLSHRLFLSMNTAFMCMLQKATTALLSKLTVRRISFETASQRLPLWLPS